MNDGESEAHGDSRVDGIASGFHDIDTGLRGKLVDADDHGVLRPHWLRLGGVRRKPENAAK
jgi:hypothetical protein